MAHPLENIIREVYAKNKRNGFAFLTGAGLSSESGIPTYRGTDGIWVKGTKFHRPEDFGTLRHFLEDPEEVWQYALFRKGMFEAAQPNDSHLELAQIEKHLGDRFHLVTQNIDNLFTELVKDRKNKIVLRETSTSALKAISEIIAEVTAA